MRIDAEERVDYFVVEDLHVRSVLDVYSAVLLVEVRTAVLEHESLQGNGGSRDGDDRSLVVPVYHRVVGADDGSGTSISIGPS